MSILDDVTTEEEFKDRIKKLAPSGYSGPHYFKVCVLCGWVNWSSSGNRGEDSVHVQDTGGSDCPRCSEVRGRSPEIYAWGNGIAYSIARQILKVMEKRDGPSEVQVVRRPAEEAGGPGNGG